MIVLEGNTLTYLTNSFRHAECYDACLESDRICHDVLNVIKLIDEGINLFINDRSFPDIFSWNFFRYPMQGDNVEI